MGLDITAYTEVNLIKKDFEEDQCMWEWVDEWDEENPDKFSVVLYKNESFPKQGKGLHNGVYSYNSSESMYSRSYSSWSNVREVLAQAAGYTPVIEFEIKHYNYDIFSVNNILRRPHQARVFSERDGILNELINFSDCEGVINTECCKKIYLDLKNGVNIGILDEDYLKVYTQLLKGFKLASENNGVVVFH